MKNEKLIIGRKYEIHAYKHAGNIHRAWDEAVLLEIHDDYLVFGNERTKVTEADGWAWAFANLPKYRDGGIEIEYVIDVINQYK